MSRSEDDQRARTKRCHVSPSQMCVGSDCSAWRYGPARSASVEVQTKIETSKLWFPGDWEYTGPVCREYTHHGGYDGVVSTTRSETVGHKYRRVIRIAGPSYGRCSKL